MRAALIPILVAMFTVGCEQQPETSDSKKSSPVTSETEKSMIRNIRFYGGDEDFGIVIDGKRAFLTIKSEPSKKIEMSYEEGLKLLEGFYEISGIEEYNGKDFENCQTSIHHLIHIYDEMPGRYSKDWVDYVIPKDKVAQHLEINAWFQAMKAAKKLAEQVSSDNGGQAR